MRTLDALLAALNVDDATRVLIAHTMGASSGTRSEQLARRDRRRPSDAAIAAHVQVLVDAAEPETLPAAGAREHVIAAPATPSSPHRRPRRPAENERR